MARVRAPSPQREDDSVRWSGGWMVRIPFRLRRPIEDFAREERRTLTGAVTVLIEQGLTAHDKTFPEPGEGKGT